MLNTTTTVTTTTRATIKPSIARKLRTELNGYASTKSVVKELDEAAKGHSAAVLALSLEGVDGDKFELDGFKVAVVKDAKDKRLDKEKLIKRLVQDGKYSVKAAQALIEDCSPEKSKKPHVRITMPGEKGDE